MSFWKFVRRMIILNFFFDLFSGKSDNYNGCSHHCDDYDDKPHNHFTGFLNNSRQNNFDDYGISAATATISMKTWTISTVSATAMTDKPNHNTSVL